MGLKCTLFGHRFGGPDVERDRDEEGSEVVSTIREVETCVRCGESRVVSENTEVTTLETPDEPEPAEADEPDAAGEAADPAGERGVEAIVRSAESAPDEDDADGGADAATDDGVILEEPAEADEREPGAWPDEPTRETDEGPPVEPGSDDRPAGAWPDEPEAEEPGWTPSTEGPDPDAADAGDAHVEPAGGAVTVPEGAYHCPECGFTTAVESSSLREGDFCPECHTGTLAHRPEDA